MVHLVLLMLDFCLQSYVTPIASLKNFFSYLFYYSCPNFSPFALFCPAHHPLPQSVPTLLSTSMGIYTCSLTSPFPFFPPLSPSPAPSHLCQYVPCFYFVHYLPIIGEVIWHLSFTNWLILLNIVFSSSIHAVTKGRSSFFLLHSVPLCKCAIVFWSTHLMMGT